MRCDAMIQHSVYSSIVYGKQKFCSFTGDSELEVYLQGIIYTRDVKESAPLAADTRQIFQFC